MPKDRPQCGLMLENSEGKILLQLRDNKQSIPYPNCWGTFGGAIEIDETPAQAMAREIKEELNYVLVDFEFYKKYFYDNYEIYMFRKIDMKIKLSDFKVREGQKADFLNLNEVKKFPCAFNCREIVKDYYKIFHSK